MFRLFFKLIGLAIKLVTLPFRILGRLLLGGRRRRRRGGRLFRKLFRNKKLLAVAAIVGAHYANEHLAEKARQDQAV